jgi:transcriptional regulator with XRE-family HTH domain
MQMEGIYEFLGSKIRKYRNKAGLSQEELGNQLSLTRGSIAKMEAGTQSIYVHSLYKIAKIFGIKITELLPAGEWIDDPTNDDELKKRIDELPCKTAGSIKRKLEL